VQVMRLLICGTNTSETLTSRSSLKPKMQADFGVGAVVQNCGEVQYPF